MWSHLANTWCSMALSSARIRQEVMVDALIEKLDARLRQWKPETAAQVRERVAEVIELADHDILDLLRSRATEQEVLDLLDEPTAG
jgi:biotin-(acetyl-CoA carboxylase) ligase